MFELNATIAIFILSFLLFMVALDHLFLKPVGGVIDERARRMEEDNESARQSQEDAAAALARYEKKLAEIREEAQTVINDAVAEAKKSRSEQLAVVEESGRTKLEAAKTSLKGERVALVDALVVEEMSLVEDIVKRLLGDNAAVKLSNEVVKKALEEAC